MPFVAPLLSRARTFRLSLLEAEALRTILERALVDEERGLGGQSLAVDAWATNNPSSAKPARPTPRSPPWVLIVTSS